MPPTQIGPFPMNWFGGTISIPTSQTVETPSTSYPGLIGVRFPEVITAITVDPETGAEFQSTSDVLLKRARASIDATGAFELTEGIAFLRSHTTQVGGPPESMATIYPIIIRFNEGIDVGTVGTDWLCHRAVRPKPGGGTETVTTVCLVKSGDPPKGLWYQWAAGPAPATMTTNMTFTQFVDGVRTIWPPEAVELDCDPSNHSPACAVGRLVTEAVKSAKLIGMVPESYAAGVV